MIPYPVWLYGLLSVVAVSLVSLVALFMLSVNARKLKAITFILISLAVGTLLGDAFFHLVPESIKELGAEAASLFILVGVLLFFILEKLFRWHHHQVNHDQHDQSVGYVNLISDGLHNFIDGLLIGVAYIVSLPIGLATTIAVFLHEIPQELSDFGILLHAGFSRTKALVLNFVSALVAVSGFVVALLLGARVEQFITFALPFAAGGFIYIAVADLIPELHDKSRGWQIVTQFIMITVGVALMFSLTFVE